MLRARLEPNGIIAPWWKQSCTRRENLDIVITLKRSGIAVFCRKTNGRKFEDRRGGQGVFIKCAVVGSHKKYMVFSRAPRARYTSAWYRLSIWNRASTQCTVTHSHTCSTFRYWNPARGEDYYFAAAATKLYWQPSDIFLFLLLSFSFFTHFNGPCAHAFGTSPGCSDRRPCTYRTARQ